MKFMILVFTALLLTDISHAVKPLPKNCDIYLQKQNLCATVNWVKQPVKVKMPTAKDAVEFTLKFWDAKGNIENGPFKNPKGNLDVSLFMPDMGHGSEAITVKALNESGEYLCSNVIFSMGGKWEIRVKTSEAGKVTDTGVMEYQLK